MKQFTLFLVFTTLFSFVLSAQKPQVQMPQGTSIVNMDQPSKGKNPLGSKGTMKNVDKVDINESSTLNQGQWYTQSFSRSELDENSKYDVEVIPEYGDPDLYIWKNSSDVIRDSRQDAMMTERLSFKLKDLLGSEDQINVSVYGYSETRFRITIRQVVTSISPPNFCNSNLAFESPSDDDRPKSGDDVYVKVVAEQYKDIEWVDLYVNNEFWSKERTHPYEWGSPGSTTDAPLRNVSPGTYDLKCIYQTRCGDRHEITKTITVESSGPDFGGDVVNKEEECPFIDEFSATSGSNGGVDLTISSNFYHEINRVDYFRNGQQIGSIFQSPFSFTDNNGSNNSDVYSATFSYVQTNETCTLTATISNTSTPQSDPCELITDFDAGLLSNGDVSLSIFTDFIQEVRQVDYYKNGQQIGSLFQSPFDYFDRNVSNGNYTYKAIIKFAQSSTDCEIEKSLSVDFNSSSDNSCLGPTNPGRICPNNYDPVCGCNDVTYSNSCLAEAAGVKSWTRGECSSSSDNSCQGITDPGRICPNNYDPVCGCNDVTYSNSCLAEAAGVKTWTRGECSNGQNCSYWEYTDRDSWYEKSFKYNEKVYFKPSNNSSIEKVEFYDENSRIGSVNKRNDGRYWFTVRSHWPERFYTCKVRIKRRNCNHWHERPFKIRVVRNHNNACDWKWRNRNEFCDKHFKHGDHWKWKMEPDHHQDIEWVEWYKESVSNSNRMRRETQYPYEWDSRNGNDSKMRNWSEGRHKVIIWVKKRCRTEPFKYECWIHFDRHNNACDWKWRNRNEFCDKHFKHGDHWKWKMEPDHHQDIEWVEWYKESVSNSNRMRRETQYPYEWDSRNGNDSKMRNWSEGRHKVIIWVKKRCRTEPFKYECWIHFDRHNNNNNCRRGAFFKDPRNNSTFSHGDHVLCVVEAERHQDIEWMDLYLNGKLVRRENQAPYEWNKFNGQRNPEFRNHLKTGANTLKCRYKTRCGKFYEIMRTFTIRSN